ncbi:hypothetical protein D3C86_363910 [compost metagenome]
MRHLHFYRAKSLGVMRHTTAAVLVATTILSPAAPALAWKPNTHVYLAEEAMKDAINDGRVTLFEVDPETGRAVGTLGAFTVDPKALAALRGGGAQFRAGVLGPDAYPDILTGQQIIHPDESAGEGGPSGSDAWLTWIHRRGFIESDDARINAFALGYLTHAAGDVFAHTYVNHFAGGEFALSPPMNAVKHLTLEGYIGERTPQTLNAFSRRIASGRPCNSRKQEDLDLPDGERCGIRYESVHLPVTNSDVGIAGVEEFIWREMIDARPGTVLADRLYRGEAVNRSIPYVFSALRAELVKKVEDYEARRARLGGVERAAFEATHGPGAAYNRAWIEDIDAGLKAWPATGHEIAKALILPGPAGADTERAETAMGQYVRRHLLSMAGLPDGAIYTVGAVVDIVGAIMPEVFVGVLEEILRAPLDAVIKGVTDRDIEEWTELLTKPHAHFNDIMMQPGGGHDGAVDRPIDLATFNREHLRLTDAAYTDPSQKWSIDQFAPAFNTLQLTKMMLLSDQGRRELEEALRARGVQTDLGSGNLMLGWVRSMDAGNQWQALPSKQAGASPLPAPARGDGMAWRKLFIPQLGEAEPPRPQPEPRQEPEPEPHQPEPQPAPEPEPTPPVPTPAPPRPEPSQPEQIPSGDDFQPLGAWSVRVDRLENPRNDRLTHVYLTLRNDSTRRLMQTEGVNVLHEDGSGLVTQSSQGLKALPGRPELFGSPPPIVLPGREIRTKFVFDRNGRTASITVEEGEYSTVFDF